MPKRSAAEKIERYEKKIRKLRERSAKRRRVRVILSDTSDNEGSGDVERSGTQTTAEIHNGPGAAAEPTSAEPASATPEPQAGPESSQEEQPAVDATVAQKAAEDPAPEVELDPELLKALGESTGDTPEYGANIHDSLAKLWLPLLKKGIPKESKDKLLKEYLIPDNCRLLQSPKLNAEISAAIPDMVRNRDKSWISQQQQLGSGITAINRTLDLLLKGDDKKQSIQHLSKACRILSDLHASFTQTRIKLITPSLDKNFLHVIQDADRDETLFGNKLSDKIKAAKAIERQGLQIKKASNARSSSAPQPGTSRNSMSGNWTAPPRYSTNRGGRGGPRKKAAHGRRSYPSPAQPTTKPAAAAAKPRAPAAQ